MDEDVTLPEILKNLNEQVDVKFEETALDYSLENIVSE